MAQGTFKLPGGGPEEQDTHPKEQLSRISDQGHFLPRGGPGPGNRAYNKMGRARDASRHSTRGVQSFGTG